MRFYPTATSAYLPTYPRVGFLSSVSRVASTPDRRSSKGRKHGFTSAPFVRPRSVRRDEEEEEEEEQEARRGSEGPDESRLKGVAENRGGVGGARRVRERNKNTRGASRRPIGRALPCRRIIICAPVRRAKGESAPSVKRVPGPALWKLVGIRRRVAYGFFLGLVVVLHLRAARRPNFVQPFARFPLPPLPPSFLFRTDLSFAEIDAGEDLSSTSGDDLLSPLFRLPFRRVTADWFDVATNATRRRRCLCTRRLEGRKTRKTSPRSDESEERRAGAATRRGFELETPTPFGLLPRNWRRRHSAPVREYLGWRTRFRASLLCDVEPALWRR